MLIRVSHEALMYFFMAREGIDFTQMFVIAPAPVVVEFKTYWYTLTPCPITL